MKRLARVLLASTLMVALALPSRAEDEKKPPPKKDPNASVFQFPKVIKLDDKQKEHLEKLREEYSPKITAITKKQADILPADRQKAAADAIKKVRDEIMTPDRIKAAKEAQKKAADEGKKGKELAKAYQDALKLTDDEQKKLKGLSKVYDDALKLTKEDRDQLAALNKDRAKLLAEINTKKMAILTNEQKEALKPKPKPKEKPAEKPKSPGEK